MDGGNGRTGGRGGAGKSRVDAGGFGGGWLDVPRLARPGAEIDNCAISPVVSLRE